MWDKQQRQTAFDDLVGKPLLQETNFTKLDLSLLRAPQKEGVRRRLTIVDKTRIQNHSKSDLSQTAVQYG
jgi:hypothetical protein